MKLSIVILTCSQMEMTLDCLRSISPLLADGETEIILVDNGSTDGTAEAVAERFPQVRVIRHEQNLGVARGRNSGLRAAGGEHLMILDNDTAASPDVIRELSHRLASSPDAGLVAPRLIDRHGVTQSSFRPYPGIRSKIINILRGKRKSSVLSAVPEGPIEPFYVIGAAQMFTRQVYHRTGGLDEAIFYGPEDADFCMAVRKLGKRVIYYPDLTIIHHWQRATTSRLISRAARIHIKALFHFYRKHGRWWR